VPVGDPDVLLGEERLHRAAQQRGEVPGQRCDEQHLRSGRETTSLRFLGEVQERAERLHVGGFLAHGDVAPPDAHGVDGPRWTLVGEADALEQPVPGREAAQWHRVGELRAALAQLTETLQSNPRDTAERGPDVRLRLVRLVEHVGLSRSVGNSVPNYRGTELLDVMAT